MLSNNIAGLKSKIQTFKSKLKETNSSLFTLQETHFLKKGQLEIKDYEIFEAIRKNKERGGTLLGAHKDLKPFLIKQYEDEFELLVVEIEIEGEQIRVITGYGPQETWPEAQRYPFFVALDAEILDSILGGKSIIIQLDANSKLGSKYIENDPHPQSLNGKLLSDIIERHKLIVVNGMTSICEGKITRKRVTSKAVEESIIDFVIVDDQLAGRVKKMIVDDKKEHVLTGFVKNKNKVSSNSTESDHMTLITSFNMNFSTDRRNNKLELFNVKNKKGLETFKQLTNDTVALSSSIVDSRDVNMNCNIFLKRLNNVMHKSFNKIRVVERTDPEIDELLKERNRLRFKSDVESIQELNKVERKLADLCAEDNYRMIKDEINGMKHDEGGVHPGKLWMLKKKLFPKSRDPPTAMLDESGNLVTSLDAIERLTVATYTKRLQNRPILSDLHDLKEDKEVLCKLKLELAKGNRTEPWTLRELDIVLSTLKGNKSRDPLGFANEMFSKSNAGDDLKLALLKLMNQIKNDQKLPDVMKLCNISSLWKRKGARNNLDNYRGIFRVTILRNILDRLIYNDEYPRIDTNLGDSNVGARKGRNVRDNIFVLNAVLTEVLKKKKEPVDIQVFDIEKCFDALWLQECINDLYDAGFKSDKLPLIYLENAMAKVAIKTGNTLS